MSRMSVRRVAYVVAALATLISGLTGLFGFAQIIPAYAMAKLGPLVLLPLVLGSGALLLLVGAVFYMARKPYGWGKLLCFAGFPWILFSANAWLIGNMPHGLPFNPLLLGPGLCGATLLIVGLILVAVDWGRPLGRLAA
jgi:predicted membrane channel-forming protein YqfA (hemolysin III family)